MLNFTAFFSIFLILRKKRSTHVRWILITANFVIIIIFFRGQLQFRRAIVIIFFLFIMYIYTYNPKKRKFSLFLSPWKNCTLGLPLALKIKSKKILRGNYNFSLQRVAFVLFVRDGRIGSTNIYRVSFSRQRAKKPPWINYLEKNQQVSQLSIMHNDTLGEQCKGNLPDKPSACFCAKIFSVQKTAAKLIFRKFILCVKKIFFSKILD